MKRIFLHQKQAFTESLLHTTNKATANTLLGCIWKKTVMILLMLYCIQVLYAINFTVGGIKYNTTGTTTVEVISNNYSGSIVIPSSVTNSSVTYSVTSIGNLAFYSCSSMTSISLPSSVTTIGDNAFNGCTGLTSFNIPSSVTSIGNGAFIDCRSLTSIVIPPSVTKINQSTFGSCYSLSSITIPSSVTSIGEFVFYNCNQLTNITIPPSVTSIGTWAFSYCSGLTNVTISPSVTYIGSAAFVYCSAIITVDKNNSNYSSLNGLLYNKKQTKLISCPFVTSGSFIIPSSVDTIAEYALFDCSNLTSLKVPSSVKSIGNSAFENCTGLTSLYSYSVIPVNLSNSYNVFNGIKTANCILYVPIGTKSLYQAAAKWQDSTNIVEFDPTRIESINTNTLEIYPNPVVEGFYVNGLQKEILLNVYDINGKMVLSTLAANKRQISTKQLSAEVYLVKVGELEKDSYL